MSFDDFSRPRPSLDAFVDAVEVDEAVGEPAKATAAKYRMALAILRPRRPDAIAVNHQSVVGAQAKTGRLFEDRYAKIVTKHRSAELQRIVIPADEVDRDAGIHNVCNRGKYTDVIAHDEVAGSDPDIEQITIDQET